MAADGLTPLDIATALAGGVVLGVLGAIAVCWTLDEFFMKGSLLPENAIRLFGFAVTGVVVALAVSMANVIDASSVYLLTLFVAIGGTSVIWARSRWWRNAQFANVLGAALRLLNPATWIAYPIRFAVRIFGVQNMLDLAREARQGRILRERDVAYALGSEMSTFILLKIGEKSSMTIRDLASNIEAPRGWVAVARLIKAGLIDENAGSFYLTETGKRQLDELRAFEV